MNNAFINNLQSLRLGNIIVAIFAVFYTIVPVLAGDLSFLRAGIFLAIAVIAMLISWYSNYVMQLINVKNRVIYALITLFYINLMFFGIYQSVWIASDKPASLIFVFFVIALLLFINPPRFNLFLTLSAACVFIVFSILIKEYIIWIYDIIHVTIASSLSLFFSWQITKLRMGMEISASELEEERNKYEDQSITDELTRLRNKRDFTGTFQRYLSNYRSSDDLLCVAIGDIDFFKLYNDHYGHLKGDDCLRTVGAALNSLKEDVGVYTARVGGDEFAALWIEKETSHVYVILNYYINSIKSKKIPHEKSKVNDFVSMSIGVYVSKCGAYHDTKILYDLADKALYTAKQGGRNCAIINGDDIKEYRIAVKDD
jgi:diguanylate cyclase (GGDEF)-like protein